MPFKETPEGTTHSFYDNCGEPAHNCDICINQKGYCNLHKPKETEEEREERKQIFIQRATSHFDSLELRKEAEELFEKQNER